MSTARYYAATVGIFLGVAVSFWQSVAGPDYMRPVNAVALVCWGFSYGALRAFQ